MKIKISEEDSNYMYNFIDNIIKTFGPRIPGSKAEARAAEYIKKEMEPICDEVSIEPFKFHPTAFLGWIKITIILVMLSLISYFSIPLFQGFNYFYSISIVLSVISVILNIVGFLIIWNEFFNYREYIDKFFRERESQNVIGKIKTKGELKKILLFSGHHDSALQFNLLRYLKYGYVIILFIALIVLFLWIGVSIIHLILTILGLPLILHRIIFWIIIIATPSLIGCYFFVWNEKWANTVPGAVDNLSAVAVVLGLGKYLKKHPEIIPKNTEIRLISFGSEEAGLRGAYRYAARHLDELKKYDAELVNMDGVMSNTAIQVLENEPTTRTRHSKEVVNKIIAAAELVEIPINKFGAGLVEKIVGQISGGTDAAAFSKAKIKAANISSMEFTKFVKFYHQPSDTIDMIQKGSLEKVLSICIGYIMNESKR
ncbi:MAG: M28 family metallopeptidase [Candidatus Helarchaeota archaeon]